MPAEEVNKTLDVSQQPRPARSTGEPKKVDKREGVLSDIKSRVSEEELKNNIPAIRLIVEQNYSQKEEIKRLIDFEGKYYDKKEEASKLSEKLKSLNSKLILTTLGGILFGLLPGIWTEWKNPGLLMGAIFVAGVFLLVGFFRKI